MNELDESYSDLTQYPAGAAAGQNLKAEQIPEIAAEGNSQDNTHAERNPDRQTDAHKEEETPLIVDLSSISGGSEEVVNLSKFQHIASGFFAQTKEPALSINGKTITVNAAAVRLFPNTEYMEILISTEDKKVAFLPCNELNIRGYKWARVKDGKRFATQRTGLPFALTVCQIMGWDPEKRYRILGKKLPSSAGEEILLFDLNAGQGFERPNPGEKGKKNRSTILTGWDGTFGPAYSEGGSTLHVDTFDGYTLFSIKEGWVRNNETSADYGQGGQVQDGEGIKNE